MRNGQGDIIGLFDGNGNIVARYSYDSWGKLLSIKDGNGNDKTNDTTFVGYKNPLRYRGYYYDSETKLYYLQSRYYNPEWGRFLNADGIIGANKDIISNNTYTYCSNNPVNNWDPSGKFWKEIVDAISKAVGWLPPTQYIVYKKTQDKNMGNYEVYHAQTDPINAYIAYQASKVATQYQQQRYPKTCNKDSNQANAFRHAMWNAVMTVKMGKENAYRFSYAHEFDLKEIQPLECEMDIQNNLLGIKIALMADNTNYDYLADKIQEAINNKQAVVINWDSGD